MKLPRLIHNLGEEKQTIPVASLLVQARWTSCGVDFGVDRSFDPKLTPVPRSPVIIIGHS